VEKEALNFENLTGQEGRFTPAQVGEAFKLSRNHSTLKISQVGKGGFTPAQVAKAFKLKRNYSTLKISQVGKGGLPPLKLQRLSS
jgi:hypothetical protein